MPTPKPNEPREDLLSLRKAIYELLTEKGYKVHIQDVKHDEMPFIIIKE